MSRSHRTPLLSRYYTDYIETNNADRFVGNVKRSYSIGTLERLLATSNRPVRRAAALALGVVGDYTSNAALGRALGDIDRGVRMIAEDSIRSVWFRAGDAVTRQRLKSVVRLNEHKQSRAAIARASELLRDVPWFAEAWHQRAVAYFNSSRFIESIGDCREALEINAYHFLAAACMGECYLHLGNSSSALECFRRALKLNPSLEGVRASVQRLERALRKKKQ